MLTKTQFSAFIAGFYFGRYVNQQFFLLFNFGEKTIFFVKKIEFKGKFINDFFNYKKRQSVKIKLGEVFPFPYVFLIGWGIFMKGNDLI